MDDSTKLAFGTRIETILGNELIVARWLAEGGQGDIYIIKYNEQFMALKWYKPKGLGKNPQAFYQNLQNNVRHGAPSEEFLWPIDLTKWKDGSFGYVMGLRPPGYSELSEFMLAEVRFPSFRKITDVALHIVSAYRILHNQGYSYQDLNDGNFFINPSTGKVLICDNDNVAPDGMETGIAGKPRYMAPEVVLGKSMPNSLSDRYSMSVILFILFCLNHPLEGKKSLVPCLSPELQEKLYGSEATFIMDPDNRENAPHPEIHKNTLIVWPYLPDYMQDLFLTAFSQKALHHPNARPSELEWLKRLVRFRSEIIPCTCGNEIFTENGKNCNCERCGERLKLPYRICFRDYAIPGVADSRIYRCQLGTCNTDEALKPIGHVIAKKSDKRALGLKNLSNQVWTVSLASGKTRKVAPNEIMPLREGMSVYLYNEVLKIEVNE